MSVFADLEPPYRAICADPPWRYVTWSDNDGKRSAEQHYGTMTPEDIRSLPVADLAADDCHLFLWITGPELVTGRHVALMEAWGFTPSSMAFVWLKVKASLHRQSTMFWASDEGLFGKGMGHTTRQNAEFVLLGRRGSPKRATKAEHQLIVAPRREHSRKPDEFYQKVRRYCGNIGPIADLFSRERRPGFHAWGNEVDKFRGAA